MIIASPFECQPIENQPKATLCTRHVPQTRRSAISYGRVAATRYTTSASIDPVSTATTPSATTQACRLSNATDSHDATRPPSHASAILAAPKSTYSHSYRVSIPATTSPRGAMTKAFFGNASIQQTSRHIATSMGSHKITPISSNITSTDHRLTNHTNTITIIVWTVPNITTTPTSSPTPRDTTFRHFINTTNSALPYLEACGLLVIIWNVGKFIHAKIQRYRGKACKFPVAERVE